MDRITGKEGGTVGQRWAIFGNKGILAKEKILAMTDEAVPADSRLLAPGPPHAAALTSDLGNFSVFSAAGPLTHSVDAEKIKGAEQAALSASLSYLST
jgi:hypothetical protein